MRTSSLLNTFAALFVAAGCCAWAAEPVATEKSAPAQEAKAEAQAGKTAEKTPQAAEVAKDDLDFIPEVVATYGADQKISAAEVRKMIKPVLARAASQGKILEKDELVMLAGRATDAIVTSRLLEERCIKDGFKPMPAEANQEIVKIEEKMGKENFAETLKQQGLELNDITREISVQLMIRKWADEKIRPTIKVSDEELKENSAAFNRPEKVAAAHILIKYDAGADEGEKKTAREKAAKILEQLKAGGDFAKLAKENSDCPSKANGGDLGSFGKGQMVPEFENAAFGLKAGELSGVVETKFGCHIIKCGEHIAAGTPPMSEIKEEITQQVTDRKMNDTIEALLEDMRKQAAVKILLPKSAPNMFPSPMPEMAPEAKPEPGK